ncbi:MAG: hypothetical protein ABI551_22145 [Polyangiaceae bacterium]
MSPAHSAVVQQALSIQGLALEDVEANRAGHVSPTQLGRLASVQGAGKITMSLMVFGGSALSIGFAINDYRQHGHLAVFIVPAVIIAFFAAIYFGVYRAFRLPMPEEIAKARVTARRARVTASMIGANRGVYSVWLDGVRHTGCAASLSDDVRLKGRIVDAYIIAERKLVVALVPTE